MEPDPSAEPGPAFSAAFPATFSTTFTAVVIDFFGTLTTSAPDDLWLRAAAASAEPLGLPAGQWRDVLSTSFVERATGVLGDLTETFRVLARRCGIEPSEAALAQACAARVKAQNALFVFRDDAAAGLEALKSRGYRLGLLSDCTPELPVAWPGLAVAPYFDTAAFSCVEGVKKPDPAFFRLVCDRLGVAPGDCLYVGDGGSRELSGAAAVGMTPVMLRADDWHRNSAHDREDDWTGPEIGSFTELIREIDAAGLSARSLLAHHQDRD
ncbi:HAD family hydrolase [Catenulispora pinisilvae]|uniref:HAD family hydrolase n=1 Tax=Catenulispora pinisilvae TaxID=2705253 RepID=UPI0018914079|nr:HAD-IA family hydrolase [Catenulispora pinisilvae]